MNLTVVVRASHYTSINIRSSYKKLISPKLMSFLTIKGIVVINPFFKVKNVLLLITFSVIRISWNDLSNPEIAPPPLDKGLANLYQEIRETVRQEAEIINAVFPNPMGVMQVFLQRIFAQLVCYQYVIIASVYIAR